MSDTTATETVTLTVHGPPGATDLVVPLGARLIDVSREYARLVRLASAPRLHRLDGGSLEADATVGQAGLASGTVLVAALGTPQAAPRDRSAPQGEQAAERQGTAPLPFVLAAGLAVAAGGLASLTESSRLYDATLALLAVAALIGVLPIGRHLDLRGATAPAFPAAAVFALVWDGDPAMLPLTVGICGAAAAVTAGVARALGTGSAVVHGVWIITGGVVFTVTGLGVLAGVEPRVVWSVLVLVAVLAARSVAAFAVDVPDQVLLDLERLSVTNWTARDRPQGAGERVAVGPDGVSALLSRGSRIVNATAAAILVTTVVAVPGLFASTPYDIDRIGARALAFFAGAALLLAARSHRHAPARSMLRVAGLFAWLVLAHDLLGLAPDLFLVATAGVSLLVGLLLTLAAIATGRGWRSVGWARRAEVAEVVAGACVVGAAVVSSGLFRLVWELPFGG